MVLRDSGLNLPGRRLGPPASERPVVGLRTWNEAYPRDEHHLLRVSGAWREFFSLCFFRPASVCGPAWVRWRATGGQVFGLGTLKPKNILSPDNAKVSRRS